MELLAAIGSQESDPTDDTISLEGYLLRGNEDSFRVVVAGLVLEFRNSDLLGLSEQPEPVYRPMVVAARLKIRRPATLLSVSDADAYRPLIEPKIEPFAYATRPSAPPMQAAPRFDALQEAFKRKLGLA